MKSAGLPDRVRFIPYDAAVVTPTRIADLVYDEFRVYRRDRCAILMNYEDVRLLTSTPTLPAAPLDYNENFHWTGPEKGLRKKRIKHIVAGDYLDWFYWYMKWRRFDAFPVLLVIRPFTRMLEDENRGFLDGLLTRLLHRRKLHRALIIEEERYRPTIEAWLSDAPSSAPVSGPSGAFAKDQLTQAALAVLSGSTLSRRIFLEAVRRTLSYRLLVPDSERLLQKLESTRWFIDRKHRWFRSLSDEGKAAIQSLSLPRDYEDVPEKKFELVARWRHARSDERWLRSLIGTYLQKSGWFTFRALYDSVNQDMQEALRGEYPPTFVDPELIGSDIRSTGHVFVPSERLLRRVLQRMVSEGKLSTTTWYREVGRPSTIYFDRDHRPPLNDDDRCGQCAFYVRSNRHCELWHLLGKAYGARDPRWGRDGVHPLDALELYKMRNSWRISPSSNACVRFVDKKKDYARKEIPAFCDICRHALPGLIVGRNLIVCPNCRTRYFRLKRTVRVQTAYGHRFREIYRELAGKDPSEDETRLREERPPLGGNTYRALERIDYEKHRLTGQGDGTGTSSDGDQPITLVLFPGDTILMKRAVGKLAYLGQRRIETVDPEGTIIVDHGVLSEEDTAQLREAGAIVRTVIRPAELKTVAEIRHYLGPYIRQVKLRSYVYARMLSVAMAMSAIHATERIGSIAEVPAERLEVCLQTQRRILRRLEPATHGFREYEALLMKEYWTVFGIAVTSRGQFFGPRVRSRFVRESVDAPNGRARGYTTVDTGINYLHQKRLYKTISTNSHLGISTAGEGLLHSKSWKERRLGLVLDLIDPQKFADREQLLQHIIRFAVNWRDFHSASDRHGVKFYYPRMEMISTLERVSDEADATTVSYRGEPLKLSEAYARSISNLRDFVTGKADSFIPFAFVS